MSGTVKGWDLRILERIAEQRRKSPHVEPFGIDALAAVAQDEAGNAIQRNAGILAQEASNILVEPSEPMIAVFSGPVDSRTCPLCAALVGQRVRTDSPEYRTYSPPLHINCRHYWLYMHPDTPGAREDFTPPDPDLVKQFGHFVTRPLEYVELKVPARPTGRDFIVRRYADRTEIEFVPHAEISPRARKTLIDLVQRSKQGAWRLPIDELTALMRDMRTGLAELENWGLIRVVTRAGEEQATFMVARSERDLQERLRAIPEWQRRRIVSVEDMGPAGHGLGAGLRQFRIVYRDVSEAEVQITRYGRLEAAGIHTPTGRRVYKVRWPAGWTKLDDEDRIALIASRRVRGPWAEHDSMPGRLRGRAPRIVFDPAISRGERPPHYDYKRHALVVPPPPGPQASELEKLQYRATLLHEAGHASGEGWECYAEFGLLHEAANEIRAQAILGSLGPGAHAEIGYKSEVECVARFLGRKKFVAAAADGQIAICETVETELEKVLRQLRAGRLHGRLGSVRELEDAIEEALALVRRKWRDYTVPNRLVELLDFISWRALGRMPLHESELYDILADVAKRLRRRFRL